MTSRGNPWRHGAVADLIVKFGRLGANHIVKTLETMRDILERMDAIEAEDARRLAAKKASENLRKGFSHDHDQQQH